MQQRQEKLTSVLRLEAAKDGCLTTEVEPRRIIMKTFCFHVRKAQTLGYFWHYSISDWWKGSKVSGSREPPGADSVSQDVSQYRLHGAATLCFRNSRKNGSLRSAC